MKRLILLFLVVFSVAISGNAFATMYTFESRDNTSNGGYTDINDLEHGYFYIWKINSASLSALNAELGNGAVITKAALHFYSIYDWTVESDLLSVYLLNNPYTTNATALSSNLFQVWDNQSATSPNPSTSPYLANTGGNTLIGTWTDPNGGYRAAVSDLYIPFTFDSTEISKLSSWINDGKVGFLLDPDCHYYNSGVKFIVETSTRQVPEPGMLMLIGSGLIGLAFAGRRRK